jgi:hypothetical protein
MISFVFVVWAILLLLGPVIVPLANGHTPLFFYLELSAYP